MWEEILNQLGMLPTILLSVLLGFIIGFERKQRFKEAGIRTHTIVCFGSALMTVISKFAFGSEADAARVAAQIIPGIGVWATAGVGMACGGGLYALAIGATAILVVAQCVFHINCRVFHSKKYYSVKIEFLQTGDENIRIKEIFGTDRFNHLVLKREDDRVVYSATLNTDKEFSSTRLNQIIAQNEFICSIERCEND